MKYLLISLILAGVINTSALAQDANDSLQKAEVYCKWWDCCDCEAYDLEKLSGDKYTFHSSFIIIITNPNILSDLSYCVKSSKKISGTNNIDYVISMLCFYNNRIDTVSFNKSFDMMKINSDYFMFNWGVLQILMDTFPQHYYYKVYGELIMRKYYER